MDVKVTESVDALELSEWPLLLAQDPKCHVFSTPEWNRCWWAAFGEGKRLFALTFHDPHPIGLAALMVDGSEAGERIRFLGGDDLTDYLGPLIGGDIHVPVVADGLLRYLNEELNAWDVFEAKCLPVPFGFAEWLAEAADRQEMPFKIDQDEMTAVMTLPASFDDYLASLSQKKRHELRRKLRRFDTELPGARLRRSTPETLADDVSAFVALHRSSEGEKGQFMNPARTRFFEHVASDFMARGWLSLDFLESGGVPVAATYSFLYEGVFYLYNSAYDSAYRTSSPGLVIVARLIERSIQEGLRKFDFLRGRERYKFDLGAEPLPLHSVTVSRSSQRQTR